MSTPPLPLPPGRQSPRRIHATPPHALKALAGMSEAEKNYYQTMVLRLLRQLANYVLEQHDASIEKNPRNIL